MLALKVGGFFRCLVFHLRLSFERLAQSVSDWCTKEEIAQLGEC